MEIRYVKENPTMWKWVKVGSVATVASLGVGLFLFGGDLFSYINTCVNQVRSEVRSNVPVEFELARANDMLEDIIPELQANVKLIAKEEVEVESLKSDIVASEQRVSEERIRISKLRNMLETQAVDYRIGHHNYSRDEVKDELSRRFINFKEAETMLNTKKELLATREQSLDAAVQMLARAKQKKVMLEARIETLKGQHRLIQANAQNSGLNVNNSKIAETDKLLDRIEKRLNVAERVLAHEARFVTPIEIDVQDEQDLLSEVDAYLKGETQTREVNLTDAIDQHKSDPARLAELN